MTTEQSNAGYMLPHTVKQHAHIWGFGAYALSLTLFSGQTPHVPIQIFFTNYHTIDLHVSYSNIQGQITV